MRKNYVLAMLLVAITINAQDQKIDSLKLLLKKYTQQDTLRANVYKSISNLHRQVDPDLGIKYADSSLQIGLKLKDNKLIFKSYQLSGLNYIMKAENDMALKMYDKAYAVALKTKDKYMQAMTLHNKAYVYSISGKNREALALELKSSKLLLSIGNIKEAISAINSVGSNYYYLADYKEANKYYFKSLKLAEQIDSPKHIATAYENIALLYKRIENSKKAEFYYLKSLAIYKKLNDISGLLNVYTNFGALKDQDGDTKSALKLYNAGMKIAVQSNNVRSQYSLLANIAISELAEKNYQKSISDFKKVLKFFNETNDFRNSAIINQYYVDAIMEAPDEILIKEQINPKTKYSKAIELLEVSLKYCIEIEALDEQRTIRGQLSKFHEKNGDYVNSLKEFKIYTQLTDSIYKSENKEAIITKDLKFESDKKEMLAKVEIQRQKIIKYTTIGTSLFLILSGILLFVIYKRRQKTKEMQKELLLNAKISEVELKALRLQMNPHFIFNSLNSISDYIQKNDTTKADYYLSKFGKLMRSILENSEEKEIPISEEIQMLELYMQLEASRLNNKFSYEFKIDPSIDIENTFIPPLILQPFIENSIWHGLAKSDESGKIIIEITRNDDLLSCVVEDNGVGRTANAAKKEKSLSLKITKDRLELLNKMKNTNASMHIVDLERGTRIEVNLPFETN